jgi:hypothetical protein
MVWSSAQIILFLTNVPDDLYDKPRLEVWYYLPPSPHDNLAYVADEKADSEAVTCPASQADILQSL